MSAYNSSAGFSEDDPDMTMINHSFIYGGTDESINSCIPIIRRQQAKTGTSPPNIEETNQDPLLGPMRQIEQILKFYRQDLKQESNTQLDCNQQLITRLIDFLRPAYSSNEDQMKDLDTLYAELLNLQETRFAEQKAKNDQISIQLRYLKKSIIANPIEEEDRNSMMTNVYRMKTMIDYDQWLAMDEETKQLQQLVKTQHERIDQLVEFLSSIDQEKVIVRSASPPLEENLQPFPEPSVKFPEPSFEFPESSVKLPEPSIAYPESSEMPNVDHVPTADAAVPMEPEELRCPLCDEKFPNDSDIPYLEHVSQCFNDVNENF